MESGFVSSLFPEGRNKSSTTSTNVNKIPFTKKLSKKVPMRKEKKQLSEELEVVKSQSPNSQEIELKDNEETETQKSNFAFEKRESDLESGDHQIKEQETKTKKAKRKPKKIPKDEKEKTRESPPKSPLSRIKKKLDFETRREIENLPAKRKRLQTEVTNCSSFLVKSHKRPKNTSMNANMNANANQEKKEKKGKKKKQIGKHQVKTKNSQDFLLSLSLPLSTVATTSINLSLNSSETPDSLVYIAELEENLKKIFSTSFNQLAQLLYKNLVQNISRHYQLTPFNDDGQKENKVNQVELKIQKENNGKEIIPNLLSVDQKTKTTELTPFVATENPPIFEMIVIEQSRYEVSSNKKIILQFLSLNEEEKTLLFSIQNVVLKNQPQKSLIHQISKFRIDANASEEKLILVCQKPPLRIYTSVECQNFFKFKQEYQKVIDFHSVINKIEQNEKQKLKAKLNDQIEGEVKEGEVEKGMKINTAKPRKKRGRPKSNGTKTRKSSVERKQKQKKEVEENVEVKLNNPEREENINEQTESKDEKTKIKLLPEAQIDTNAKSETEKQSAQEKTEPKREKTKSETKKEIEQEPNQSAQQNTSESSKIEVESSSTSSTNPILISQ